MKTEMNMEEDEYSFKHKSFETTQSSINDTKVDNETTELFQNVLTEVMRWQNQSSGKTAHKYGDVQRSFAAMNKSKLKSRHNAQLQGNVERSPVTSATEKDLSFSFLLKQSQIGPKLKKPKHTLINDRHFVDAEAQACNNDASSRNYTDDAFEGSLFKVSFKPHKTSTPKRMSAASTETSCAGPRDHSISNKIIDHKRYRLNSTLTNKKNCNSSMSTFLGIVNESCSTLIKGFKNIFAAKKASDNTEDKSGEIDPSHVEENKLFADSIKREKFNITNVAKECSVANTTSNYCSSCNDTVILRHKLTNDVFLQQTVNRLKRGINLYGCDFKKISRIIWPHEPYMTPNVLYNLYRKLIRNKK